MFTGRFFMPNSHHDMNDGKYKYRSGLDFVA